MHSHYFRNIQIALKKVSLSMTPFSDFLFEFNDFSCLKMHCIKMIFFMRLDKSHISRTQTRKIENNQIWI